MTASTEPRHAFLIGGSATRHCPGGGEVQLEATAEALRRRGITAHTELPPGDRFGPGAVLHLFGSHREFVSLAEEARRQGVPVVLSPIAWFDPAARWREPGPWARRAGGAAALWLRQRGIRWPHWRSRLYRLADRLLPNSQAEAEQLIHLFGVPAEKIAVVPNGCWPRFAHAAWLARRSTHPVLAQWQGYVLCPGRIEPRKNQLELIRALAASGRKLVLLGRVVPGHEDYLAQCRREAGPQVRFVPPVPHASADQMAAYARCGCLVLPSWFETPGLVALEAGASGTPLVLPRRGAAPEYFGPLARYVDPRDRPGMAQAVAEACRQGRNPRLAQLVLDHFTWHHAAAVTAEVYRQVLGARCSSARKREVPQ